MLFKSSPRNLALTLSFFMAGLSLTLFSLHVQCMQQCVLRAPWGPPEPPAGGC